MTLRTKNNLTIAMHGEAFSSAKYRRFAAFARTRNNDKIADLMNSAADESRIAHFAREIEVAGLISDDRSNLQDVIRDKLYHTERYRQFAQEAEQDGDVDAAKVFRRLATDDESAGHEFEAALAQCQPVSA